MSLARNFVLSVLVLLVVGPTLRAQEPPAKPVFSLATLEAFEAKTLALRDHLQACTVGLRVSGAQGSGVVVTADGYVLTAAHVFDRAGQDVQVIFKDGRVEAGKTLGREANGDFGLIRLLGKNTWDFAPMAPRDGFELHQPCIALGHPGGFEEGRLPVLRFGHITSINGPFVRTNCVIDQGDSGGPLFDLEGRVIGIHSRIMPNPAINYHVPITPWIDHWDRLVAGEVWRQAPKIRPDFAAGPVLGIRGVDQRKGVVVAEVYDGYPAEAAGLLPGDVIAVFDGKAISDFGQLIRQLRRRQAGDVVDLVVLREAKRLEISLIVDEKRVSENPFRNSQVELVLADRLALSRAAIVRLRSRSRGDASIATAFEEAGGFITKASELPDDVRAVDDEGREHGVTIVAVDESRDLALLAIEDIQVAGLTLASESSLVPGRFLYLPRQEGGLAALGTVAVGARRIRGATGFLGVSIESREGQVWVGQVTPNSAAAAAGLEPDDFILRVGGTEVSTPDELIAQISAHDPGTKLRLLVRRASREFEAEATLGRRREAANARFRRTRWGRGYSQRKDDFPSAVQIDGI
ncbi:MAG: PDZ domain-containing protein, partial [Planctomycetes bacterium]|nr:PDZ domain-containing protein [Planctomycetota bacterium]